VEAAKRSRKRRSKFAKLEIVSPISGTVTQQDAKIGQQATRGTPLVSVIGTGGFEVDAGVSETDVGNWLRETASP